MGRRIGGQYFASPGEKRQTARRARMKQAETVQRSALSAGPGFQAAQRLSNSNRVSRQLLGGSSNRYSLGGSGGNSCLIRSHSSSVSSGLAIMMSSLTHPEHRPNGPPLTRFC